MADIFDAASDLEELHRAKAIEYRKPILSPIGRCHNCLEPLEDNRLFCDAACRNDHRSSKKQRTETEDNMTEERRQSTDPLLKQIHDDLQNIKALQEAQKIMLEEVKEIVSAWNNAKGFVKTVKVIGDVLKWAVAFGAAVAAIYYWMKR